MILDYNPATKAFIIRVKRSDKERVRELMEEYGFDFSETASSREHAVLFTEEPYAAAAFHNQGTDRAKAQLQSLVDEFEASWKGASSTDYSRWCQPGKELWPFQKANLDYALRRPNTLIGDEPGLGKTETAIVFANAIGAKHVLVICPASIRRQWQARVAAWSTLPPSRPGGGQRFINSIDNGKKGVHPRIDRFGVAHDGWNIVSYDLASTKSIGGALAAEDWDLLVLDEAHYLKTIDSKRTRAVFGGGKSPLHPPIAHRARRILALTGTPLPNRPREAYTLARALCFDAIDWLSEDGFRFRFNPSQIVEVERKDGTMARFVDERSGRHAELQARLRSNFMVRHLKREVMPQLQMPVYDIIQLRETGAVKEALRAEKLLDIDPEHLEGANVEVLGHVATVRKMMGIALAPQVADYIEMLLDGGEHKLVLFAWHVEVLNILEKRLAEYGVVRIDGSTSVAQRKARIDAFVENPQIEIALGNLLSMGVGVDGLQKVSCHGLIAEPDWVAGNNIQAFDRLDRGGQRQQVQGDIFVAPGSFAERILASALRKLTVTHAALDRRTA